MKLKKLMYAKDPEIDQDLDNFFNDITGGGTTEVEEDVEAEEETEDAETDEEDLFSDDDDSRGDDKDKEEEKADEETEKEVDPNVAMIAKLEEQNKKLEEQNKKLMAMMQNVTAPKAEPKKAEPDPDIFEGEVFTKLSEVLELDAGGAEILASFMKKFGSSVAKTAVNDAMEQTPQIVTRHVSEANNARDTKKNFYNSHPALEAVQGYVAQIANSVAAENPTFTVDQVLEESANRSYTALNIDKDAIAKKDKPGKGKRPAFANTPKARKPAPKVDKLLAELDQL